MKFGQTSELILWIWIYSMCYENLETLKTATWLPVPIIVWGAMALLYIRVVFYITVSGLMSGAESEGIAFNC